jgi:ATPase subunit of ABC transporter with duplicated ATPase domains
LTSYQINKSAGAESVKTAPLNAAITSTKSPSALPLTAFSKNASSKNSSAQNKLVLSNICFQHSNGEMQFENIHLSLPNGLTGLVGDNGAGKSLLAAIIRGVVKPTAGQVELGVDLLFLGQQGLLDMDTNQTVADALDATAKLNALKLIEQGSINEEDFATVGDDWLFADNFETKLKHISPNIYPDSLLSDLSGGEQSKVALLGIFESAQRNPCVIILDEPSNHLDTQAKQWLATQLEALESPCLLISHDQFLLELCQHIASLNSDGLQLLRGNYSVYQTAKSVHNEARDRKLSQLKSDKKKASSVAQRDTEKAQKRASQGANKAKQGGQPKVLIGAKQNKAEGALASKIAQHNAKFNKIEREQLALQNAVNAKPIKFAFTKSIKNSKQLFEAENLASPHIVSPITLRIFSGAKWHLCGANGSGKSTFLHMLHKSLKASDVAKTEGATTQKNNISGRLRMNTETCLLDQHCSLLLGEQNLLDNLSHFCGHISPNDLRTLLASNGFRKDRVFQKAASLSGGEKMRLAMLIASHQPDSLLLLDEPDNHLDMSSKNILADALQRYEGSFLLVSHDADFVARCGVTNTYELS